MPSKSIFKEKTPIEGIVGEVAIGRLATIKLSDKNWLATKINKILSKEHIIQYANRKRGVISVNKLAGKTTENLHVPVVIDEHIGCILIDTLITNEDLWINYSILKTD